MKERQKLIFAIVAVLAIIVLVGGATFAYWQWSTSTEQRTNVSFTITESALQGQLSATLQGNGTEAVSNLAPAACTNSTYALKKEVVITHKNATTQDATVSATLTVSNFTAPHKTANATSISELSNLKYALTTGTNAGSSCTSGTVVQSGNFSSLVFGSSSTSANSQTLFTQTFTSPANMVDDGTQTYYLWVWIDSTYDGENVGNTVSDALQDLTFTLTWSGTIVQNES